MFNPEHQQNIIIRKPEVRARTGLSDSQIWRLEARGEFPARVRLGELSVGWHASEVDQWIKSRPRAGGTQPPLPKSRRQQAADRWTPSRLEPMPANSAAPSHSVASAKSKSAHYPQHARLADDKHACAREGVADS